LLVFCQVSLRTNATIYHGATVYERRTLHLSVPWLHDQQRRACVRACVRRRHAQPVRHDWARVHPPGHDRLAQTSLQRERDGRVPVPPHTRAPRVRRFGCAQLARWGSVCAVLCLPWTGLRQSLGESELDGARTYHRYRPARVFTMVASARQCELLESCGSNDSVALQ
jgi:hypothetical protein